MFNKKRCIDNIYKLAKEKGIKIGDLEETANVSKGYLSRINKEDVTSSPSIELLESVSKQLGVGIDFLLYYSDEELTENERFVFRFVDKLMKMTIDGKLEWAAETKAYLTAESDDEVENPLVFVVKDFDGYQVTEVGHEYRSAIHEGTVYVSGTCYHAKLPTGRATVYLNYLEYIFPSQNNKFGRVNQYDGVIEMYMLQNKEVNPICSTYYVAKELNEAVCNLYTMVDSAPSKIALTPSTRSTMQGLIDMD